MYPSNRYLSHHCHLHHYHNHGPCLLFYFVTAVFVAIGYCNAQPKVNIDKLLVSSSQPNNNKTELNRYNTSEDKNYTNTNSYKSNGDRHDDSDNRSTNNNIYNDSDNRSTNNNIYNDSDNRSTNNNIYNDSDNRSTNNNIYNRTINENNFNIRTDSRNQDYSNIKIDSFANNNRNSSTYSNSFNNSNNNNVKNDDTNDICNSNTRIINQNNYGNNESNVLDVMIRFRKLLCRECNMKSLVMLSDAPYHIRTFLTNNIAVSALPFMQYKHFTSMYQFLKKIYVDRKNEFFVIATDKPGHVLRQVDSVYKEENHGRLALLPHRTKWIVIAWTGPQWEEVVAQQYKSALDNVAMIKLQNPQDPSLPYKIRDIVTFMWRQNRTREPNRVDLNSLELNDCGLFPNIRNGMNGRKLVVGPKVFLKLFLHTEQSPTGEEEYAGLLLDVLSYSSRKSNYTYVFHSPGCAFAYRGINWDEYVNFLNNGSMDIGLSTWPILLDLTYNLTFSYPVAFGKIVGIYRRPSAKLLTQSWAYLFPFPVKTDLLILGVLVYMALLYMSIIGYSNSFHGEGSEKHIPRKNNSFLFGKNRSILGEHQEGKKDKGRVSFTTKIHDVFVYFMSTLSQFMAASLNQSYLPRPPQLSARIVVGVWAIGNVLIYAFYSSSITAQAVKPLDGLPFTTFRELLHRNDYRCAMLKDSVLYYAMRAANKSALIAELESKTDIVNISKGDIIDNNLPHFLANLKENTVFIHYETVITAWLRSYAQADDYFIMADDPLFSSDISIVFPHGSELKSVLSRDIRSLYESGIQFKLLKNFSALLSHGFSNQETSSSDAHEPVGIGHLLWLGIIIGVCLAMSVVALVLEISLKRGADSLIAFVARSKHI